MRWLVPIAICTVLSLGCSAPGPDTLPCSFGTSAGACCTPDSAEPCADSLACVSFLAEAQTAPICVAPCETAEFGAGCEPNQICVADIDGRGACVDSGGTVGASCASENACRPGLRCLDLGGGGVCTADCGTELSCPPSALVGTRLCIRVTGDLGAFCMRPCAEDADCADGAGADLVCTVVGDSGAHVCFPRQ